MSTLTLGAPAGTVRPAAPADLPTLGRLGALLMSIHHAFDPARFIATTDRSGAAYGDAS